MAGYKMTSSELCLAPVFDEMSEREDFLVLCHTEFTGDVKSENEREHFQRKNVLVLSSSLSLPKEHNSPEPSASKQHHICNVDAFNGAHQQQQLHFNRKKLACFTDVKWLSQRCGTTMMITWCTKEGMIIDHMQQKYCVFMCEMYLKYSDGVHEEDMGRQNMIWRWHFLVFVLVLDQMEGKLMQYLSIESNKQKENDFRNICVLTIVHQSSASLASPEPMSKKEADQNTKKCQTSLCQGGKCSQAKRKMHRVSKDTATWFIGLISFCASQPWFICMICWLCFFNPGLALMSPASNVVAFPNFSTALNFTCFGGTNGHPFLTLNGSQLDSIKIQGLSHGIAQDPTTGIDYFWLSILPTPSINNTIITCAVIDLNGARVESNSLLVQIQGPLAAPHNFSVAISNASNATFIVSWNAPFSLHNTNGLPDIFNYILCTNVTKYGCRIIPSEPNCTFPKHCISSVCFAGELSTDTVSDDGPIGFSLSAVNGAGIGFNATFVFMNVKDSPSSSSQDSIGSSIGLAVNSSAEHIPYSLYLTSFHALLSVFASAMLIDWPFFTR